MTSPLRLHYAPDNASLCVRLALEAMDIAYETQLVDRRQNAQKSSQFLAMNPNGLIPVLETSDGPMFETAAILLWLADRHGALFPTVSGPGRMHALQWLMWLSNTLHPTLRILFNPSHFVTGSTASLIASHQARLIAHLDLLEAAQTVDFLEDPKPSILHCYLAPMLRWPALYGAVAGQFEVVRWPRLHRFAQRFEMIPTVRRACVAEGLGPHPFSAPIPCDPPEGYAI